MQDVVARPLKPAEPQGHVHRVRDLRNQACVYSARALISGKGGFRSNGFFFGGAGSNPSLIACFRASLRARRTASDFSRVFLSDGFSYERRCFISRKTPSRCIFFLRTRSACSTLLSLTSTCKLMLPGCECDTSCRQPIAQALRSDFGRDRAAMFVAARPSHLSVKASSLVART